MSTAPQTGLNVMHREQSLPGRRTKQARFDQDRPVVFEDGSRRKENWLWHRIVSCLSKLRRVYGAAGGEQ